jgi:hypothetical protein
MRKLVLVIFLFILPLTSAVQISEIMYDLEGADSGYEWVEVYNDGDDVDLCSLRFYEAETNHYIKGEDCQLVSGEYVIIADRPENIVSDCTVLDSAFSLSNTGELLCIRDATKDLFCVEYSSALGAAGNGDSLQLIDDTWIASEATPCSGDIVHKENSAEQDKLEVKQEENNTSYEEEQEEVKIEKAVKQKPVQTKQEAPAIESIQVSYPIYTEPETISKVTSSVVYESKTEQRKNVPILLLLTVSITLNVVLIASSIQRSKRERV